MYPSQSGLPPGKSISHHLSLLQSNIPCRVPYTRQEETDPQTILERLDQRLTTNGSWGITTALAFGLAITVLAYVSGRLRYEARQSTVVQVP